MFKKRELHVSNLPETLTIGDLADLLAYRNSKIVLPGGDISYETPDGEIFKTYEEASSHLDDLIHAIPDDIYKTVQPGYYKGKKITNYYYDGFIYTVKFEDDTYTQVYPDSKASNEIMLSINLEDFIQNDSNFICKSR